MAELNTAPLTADQAAVSPMPISGPGQQIDPSTPPAPPPGDAAPQKRSVWSNILHGALNGLTNTEGQSHGLFGGIISGISGQEPKLEEDYNTARQARNTQLNFESVKAADSHIQAMDQHRRADQLDAAGKLDYSKSSAEYQAFLMNNFGIAPDLSFNDSHNEATAGLTTLANNNGGAIPAVAAVFQPAPDGEHGKGAAYSPSQQTFNQNMSGYRKLIDTARSVQGMPPVDDASFNSMGFKGAKEAALSSIEFLKPTPTFSLNKDNPNYLPTVLAQKQQQLQQYQDHKDGNGKPDADPSVVKQLQNGIDYLQKSWDSTTKMQADEGAKAETAKKLAEESTPGGKATVAKNQAQAEQAQTQATLNEQALGRSDDFGNKVGLPGEAPKVIQDKQKVFNKAYVEPLAPLVKSDQEFNRILGSGNNMTPAEKVTGLLQAVGISFDPLKGKGARLNNDIIQEHAGARDIYQGALQRIDSLRPGGGGPITAKQVRDYADIARGVLHDAYVYNAHEAQRQGLPVDFLPKAEKQGETAPNDILKIYMDSANGDAKKAEAALVKAGYK